MQRKQSRAAQPRSTWPSSAAPAPPSSRCPVPPSSRRDPMGQQPQRGRGAFASFPVTPVQARRPRTLRSRTSPALPALRAWRLRPPRSGRRAQARWLRPPRRGREARALQPRRPPPTATPARRPRRWSARPSQWRSRSSSAARLHSGRRLVSQSPSSLEGSYWGSIQADEQNVSPHAAAPHGVFFFNLVRARLHLVFFLLLMWCLSSMMHAEAWVNHL